MKLNNNNKSKSNNQKLYSKLNTKIQEKFEDENNNEEETLKLKQLEDAIERLEKFQAKGWKVMIESTKKQIAKLEAEIDALEG